MSSISFCKEVLLSAITGGSIGVAIGVFYLLIVEGCLWQWNC